MPPTAHAAVFHKLSSSLTLPLSIWTTAAPFTHKICRGETWWLRPNSMQTKVPHASSLYNVLKWVRGCKLWGESREKKFWYPSLSKDQLKNYKMIQLWRIKITIWSCPCTVHQTKSHSFLSRLNSFLLLSLDVHRTVPPGRVCCVWLVCFSTFYCTVNEGRHVWFPVFVNAFSKLH